MDRRLAVLLAALALAGCAAPPRIIDNSQRINSGVDIIPKAVLVAERTPPSSRPDTAPGPDLIDTISRSDQHHYHLVQVLRSAGMVKMLQESGPYTILAPTDDAFDKFPPGLLDRMLEPENHDRLVAFAKLHLLRGKLSFADLLSTKGSVPTLSGQAVVINGMAGKVVVDDANVLRTDTSANNGVVHWMDNVLLPK